MARYKPEPPVCKICGEIDCLNEMCQIDGLHYMHGDESVPQIGDEYCREFFTPVDYSENAQ